MTSSENPLDLTGVDEDQEASEGANELSSFQGRHDGWTGRRMAMFCALLAETGIVTDACHAVGMSRTTAYEARRRSPLFAAAWEEALGLARDRLADELLERSLTGCVEKYYRDGELVGEKRILDNKLGVAILRRLDRMAETGLALHSNLLPSVRAGRSRGTMRTAPDWDLMLSALKSGNEDMMAEAMIQVRKLETEAEGDEAYEADNPPNRPPGALNFDDDEEEPDPRCWWDEEDDVWMTDFPPPPGFSGYEKGRWGDEDYKRECTAGESARLKAAYEAELAEERTQDEAERDQWFAALRHPGLEPGPACSSNSDVGRQAPDQVRGDAEEEPGPAFTSAAKEESRSPPPDRATPDSPHE